MDINRNRKSNVIHFDKCPSSPPCRCYYREIMTKNKHDGNFPYNPLANGTSLSGGYYGTFLVLYLSHFQLGQLNAQVTLYIQQRDGLDNTESVSQKQSDRNQPLWKNICLHWRGKDYEAYWNTDRWRGHCSTWRNYL